MLAHELTSANHSQSLRYDQPGKKSKFNGWSLVLFDCVVFSPHVNLIVCHKNALRSRNMEDQHTLPRRTCLISEILINTKME
jgi:hypothetical protein